MVKRTLIKTNSYQDSIELMKISVAVSKIDGVVNASVMMATTLNKAVLEETGMLTPEAEAAGSSDMLIVVEAESDEAANAAFAAAEKAIAGETVTVKNTSQQKLETLAQVTAEEKHLAFISTPGVFAAEEALKALKLGMNVFMFSDNVTIEDEVRLKKYAHEKDLILMGPDCGTAHLNGIPYGFANAVRSGGIGIVGASGTGIQEVMCLVDRFGGGISNVFGTGSHDLSEKVGGISMLDSLECLIRDETTKVIVLISKPPHPAVADKLRHAVLSAGKPTVICFVGNRQSSDGDFSVLTQVDTLEEAAIAAVKLEKGSCVCKPCEKSTAVAADGAWLRGLYSGGTLAYEAIVRLKEKGIKVYSNIALSEEEQLENARYSKQNTVIDMGDDTFTRGKPHPMIDMTARAERIRAEASDPEVKVILLDAVLGYGANLDPAAELCPVISECLAARSDLNFVVEICGTPADPQSSVKQAEAFEHAGATVKFSNIRAVEAAWSLLCRESE